jgi:hypothetical protein
MVDSASIDDATSIDVELQQHDANAAERREEADERAHDVEVDSQRHEQQQRYHSSIQNRNKQTTNQPLFKHCATAFDHNVTCQCRLNQQFE